LHTQSAVLTGAEAADCPVCGAPLSPEHRVALLTQNQARVAELDAAIAESQAQQDAVEKERRDHEKTLRALDRKIKRLPRPAEAEEIAAQIAARQGELAEREAAVAEARAGVAALETRRTALEATLDELEPQLAAIEAARDAQQRAVRELEAQLAALPRPTEAETLAEHVEAQRQIVAESETAVAALRDAPDELARVETKLAALGDPRRAYQRAGDVAAQREATDAEHAETVACIGELEVRHKALTAQMAVYANLDARLSAARAARDARAPDHQRYLQHEREAATLAECRTALVALQAEVQTAEVRRDEHVAARDALAAQYDAAAYAALVTRHGALREELAALDAGLQHRRMQQATVQTEVARLAAVQRDLEGTQTERDELVEVHALLEHLRQILRDAGPEVTRTLVAMISLHADRLYADIMQSYAGQNPATHLRWTEDYDIVLTSEGRDRTFQQLSGGEQMAAALAVRLALLREVSTVDVAFFDEPTANLDRDRRANLAAQILNVKGFSQLFVISHDDTFEQDTDYVVRIEKVDGESRVAAE
jgi:exonuclease SbcC